MSKEIDTYMREALNLGSKSFSEGGVPIGSVLVRDGLIIGRGHNRRIQNGDPTAHAEIDCLRNAGRQSTYKDTTIYSTLMPCAMCAGAIVQFGIGRVIAGEDRSFESSAQFLKDHGVDVVDLDLDECFDLLARFQAQFSQLWNEDIGLE